MDQLQTRLDQEAVEYTAETSAIECNEPPAERSRRASLFMQHAAERLEETVRELLAPLPRRFRVTPSDKPIVSMGVNE